VARSKQEDSVSEQFAVVQPDEAEPLQVDAKAALVAPQALSGGSYSVMDQEFQAGLLVPVHAHAVEDQAVFVVTGTLTVWVDGAEREVRAGGFAFRPAGRPHALWNSTGETVRFLEITNPAERFEEYLKRLSDLRAAGGASPEAVAALASGYGVAFFPDLTAELEARTGTSPSGAFWK
jgi:quercetin dioxygenase-like cupin family protein